MFYSFTHRRVRWEHKHVRRIMQAKFKFDRFYINSLLFVIFEVLFIKLRHVGHFCFDI